MYMCELIVQANGAATSTVKTAPANIDSAPFQHLLQATLVNGGGAAAAAPAADDLLGLF